MYKLIKSQIWKTCSLFCHFIFLLVAFRILLVKIYATSKKLLVAKKIGGRPLYISFTGTKVILTPVQSSADRI